jgi:hypothetical protein
VIGFRRFGGECRSNRWGLLSIAQSGRTGRWWVREVPVYCSMLDGCEGSDEDSGMKQMVEILLS